MARIPVFRPAPRWTLFAWVALAVLAAAPTPAAEYRGRNVDGKRYMASISNNDYGTYTNVEVKFQGERAYVQFARGGRLTLILEDESIVDPRSIAAYDHVRGISWEIDIHGMNTN